MNITRRDFLKLAGAAGLFFSVNKVHAATNDKILVVFYSRTGEEYGVGNISKGNTAIIAEIIAEKLGNADVFEIKPVNPYPVVYDECLKVASREKATKARPNYVGDVNISAYDIIFCGYPIWYGDSPQIIYTFLENHDFTGKKIVPFCTSGGSGLSSTDQNISLTCPTAQILQGFEIHGTIAQKSPLQAEKAVETNLKRLGLI